MKILVLPGDGIGAEITQSTLAVLDRANAKFKLGLEWVHDEMGEATLKKEGTTLPARVLETARKCAGVILGPVSHLHYPPRDKGGLNPSGEFRVKLDLYANVRPAKSRMGLGMTGKLGGPGDLPRVHRRFLCGPQHVHGHRRIHADRRHGARGAGA